MNCFNGEVFLRQAIESVFAQTYPNWELIFWDNQSTDSSAQIFQAHNDSRCHYYYAPRHAVLGIARKMAIAKAKGEWIAFLDCDDVWLSHKLESQVQIILEESKNGNLGLVYGRTDFFDDRGQNGPLIPRYHNKPLPEGRVLDALLTEENFISLVSTMVLKKAYDELGDIPDDYQNGFDYYIFAGIAARYQVRAVQQVCCRYRVHANNLTRSLHITGREEEIKTIQHWAPFSSAQDALLRRKQRRLRSAIGLSIILRERRFMQGLVYIWKNRLLLEVVALIYDRFFIRNRRRVHHTNPDLIK